MVFKSIHFHTVSSFLKTKYMLEKQSGEQEIKALKDEIRSLHVR